MELIKLLRPPLIKDNEINNKNILMMINLTFYIYINNVILNINKKAGIKCKNINKNSRLINGVSNDWYCLPWLIIKNKCML